MPEIAPVRPQALLFDLGGVLVDIDFSRAIDAWSRRSALSVDELRRRFTFDEPYERHERGELPAHEYFRHLADTLRLDGSLEEIERGWNSIFVAEIEPTRRQVERLRGKLPCFAFTNTNASHMNTWTRLYPGVVGAFDGIFASHQLGLRKPQREAFERVCRLIALPAQAVVFFDDLLSNVEAARACGLAAVHVRSPGDVTAALRRLELHDATA